MVIGIGSDHAGFSLKEYIKESLRREDYEFIDFGTKNEEKCDYPDYALLVGYSVREKKCSLGILICRTGIGMCIAANKIKGVYAALCFNEEMASFARRHNEANILTLGAEILSFKQAESIVLRFLKETPEGGRHSKRVYKIKKMEEEE